MSRVNWLGFRTGFPFAVKPTTNSSDVGLGTLYPIAMTLTELAKIYWRVKEWSVEGTTQFGTFDPNDLSGTVKRNFRVSVVGGPPGVPIDKEAVLCNTTLITDRVTNVDGSAGFYMFYDCLIYAGSYYPAMLWGDDSSSIDPVNVTAMDYTPSETKFTASFTGSCEFEITSFKPSMYFTYNGLYNETTGERL